MAQYSYPLLQSDEILTVLRELTIDATSDDLINPTPQKVHVVFSQLVELLLNQKQEDTAQPQNLPSRGGQNEDARESAAVSCRVGYR